MRFNCQVFSCCFKLFLLAVRFRLTEIYACCYTVLVHDEPMNTRPNAQTLLFTDAARLAERSAMSTATQHEFTGVFSLFEYAIAHTLKYPKIRLQTALGAPVCLSRAGSKSIGQIMVTDGAPFGSNVYYGRVTLDGEFIPSQVRSASVVDLLARLASDPARVASEYGRLTGNCCFCELRLTDARSTAVGYGPICADHFGLPWGC